VSQDWSRISLRKPASIVPSSPFSVERENFQIDSHLTFFFPFARPARPKSGSLSRSVHNELIRTHPIWRRSGDASRLFPYTRGVSADRQTRRDARCHVEHIAEKTHRRYLLSPRAVSYTIRLFPRYAQYTLRRLIRRRYFWFTRHIERRVIYRS